MKSRLTLPGGESGWNTRTRECLSLVVPTSSRPQERLFPLLGGPTSWESITSKGGTPRMTFWPLPYTLTSKVKVSLAQLSILLSEGNGGLLPRSARKVHEARKESLPGTPRPQELISQPPLGWKLVEEE